jgi:hypothetical protein
VGTICFRESPIAYADSLDAARVAFDKLKATWTKDAGDAVARMDRDIDALLAHYEFPRDLPVRSLMGPPEGVFRSLMGPPLSQHEGATGEGG